MLRCARRLEALRHAQSPAILFGFSAHDFQARKITLVGLALALMLRGQKFWLIRKQMSCAALDGRHFCAMLRSR